MNVVVNILILNNDLNALKRDSLITVVKVVSQRFGLGAYELFLKAQTIDHELFNIFQFVLCTNDQGPRFFTLGFYIVTTTTTGQCVRAFMTCKPSVP